MADSDLLLSEAASGLQRQFGIGHSTLQVERGGVSGCRQAEPGSL